MEIVSEHEYNVMDGEPHLGKQIETTIQVSRDEYIEGLVDAFLNGCESVGDEFEIEDRELDIVQSYRLGDDLSQNDIDNIISEMNIHLLDDDYGSGKDYELLYDLLDGYIPDSWCDEFDIVHMRGY